MRIHHKNMQYICNTSTKWISQNLSYLGIDKFSCNVIDLKRNTYLPAACRYHEYCEFMEKKHHLNMAARISPGIRHWHNSELLYQFEQGFRDPEEIVHIMDWTVKTNTGFELFCVMSRRLLVPQELNALKQWLHVFSYHCTQLQKQKPRAVLELENREALLEQYLSYDEAQAPMPIVYQKARFDDLVLTGKEQAYIQHMILQRTYKEIAALYQVTEVSVRKVITNIKSKLGCPSMSISEMFTKLNSCGALGACMQVIHQN